LLGFFGLCFFSGKKENILLFGCRLLSVHFGIQTIFLLHKLGLQTRTNSFQREICSGKSVLFFFCTDHHQAYDRNGQDPNPSP
jgi:hypothetical protein